MDMNIEKMIEDCEKTRRAGETIVFAIGAGRIAPKFGMKKQQKAAADLITSLDGFIGIHPISLWKTLLIFDTLNHAKAGMNIMKENGINLGNIVPILVPDVYAKGVKA